MEGYKQLTIFDFIEKPKSIVGTASIHRYLRYGPHTLVPEVRGRIKAYLDNNGVPDWVQWDKGSLPCRNCTWFDGVSCRGGGHTCHYEYDYLICDRFKYSCVERKLTTVGR